MGIEKYLTNQRRVDASESKCGGQMELVALGDTRYKPRRELVCVNVGEAEREPRPRRGKSERDRFCRCSSRDVRKVWCCDYLTSLFPLYARLKYAQAEMSMERIFCLGSVSDRDHGYNMFSCIASYRSTTSHL